MSIFIFCVFTNAPILFAKHKSNELPQKPSFRDEPDRRIQQLDNYLKKLMPYVEKALTHIDKDGTKHTYRLSYKNRPETFIATIWSFKYESEKIKNYMKILQENISKPACAESLQRISEIFYWQFRRVILNLPALPDDQKREALDTFFKIQDSQKITSKTSLDAPPINLIFLKTVIKLFLVYLNTWSYQEKVDFSAQKLDEAKRDLIGALQNTSLFNAPTEENLIDFTDILKLSLIKKPWPIPWKKIAKYTAISGATSIAFIATSIVILLVTFRITNSFTEQAKTTKALTKTINEKGIQINFPEEFNDLAEQLAKTIEGDGSGEPGEVTQLIGHLNKLLEPSETPGDVPQLLQYWNTLYANGINPFALDTNVNYWGKAKELPTKKEIM